MARKEAVRLSDSLKFSLYTGILAGVIAGFLMHVGIRSGGSAGKVAVPISASLVLLTKNRFIAGALWFVAMMATAIVLNWVHHS